MSDQLVRGATWMVSLRWVVRGLGFLRVIVLARLLAPDDFGVFTIGIIVLGFIEFLSEGGIEFALIREQAASREHFDSAWTIQIILGLLTGALIFASAPLVASIFNEPRAELVVQIIALRPAFNAFTNIGVVFFLKEFDFRKEFLFDVVRNLIDATTTIVLAVILMNYIALVLGAVTGAALATVFSYIIHPYRPRFCFKKIREIWSFSGWLLVSYATEQIADLIDRTVIGVIAAANVLGIYQMASSLGGVIMQSTIFPLWRGLFPAYAKLVDKPAELAQAYYSVFAWVVLISCAAGFGIASVAPDLVVVLLGEKWIRAIALVPYLAIAIAIAGIVDTPLLILTALGHTKLCAIQSLIRVVLLAIALPLAGTVWGAEGVAKALFGVAILHSPIPFYFLTRKTSISPVAIFLHAWRPVISGGMLFLVVSIVADSLDMHPAMALGVEIVSGGIAFVACNFVFWAISGRPSGPETTLIDIAKKRLRTRRAA